MLENSIPVVFKEQDFNYEYFEYLHHFVAKKTENGYTIIDWFGRASEVELTTSEFEEMFMLITKKEFSDYADAIQSGENELYEKYLKELKATYKLN